MNEFFAGVIQDDPSNLYFCICFRAEPPADDAAGTGVDDSGEVFWTYTYKDEINVAVETGGADPDEPLVMIGVRLNRAIILRRQPNFFHTRWNISHSEPEFDKNPRNNLIRTSPGCGKADLLQEMWINDLSFQMSQNPGQRQGSFKVISSYIINKART